MEQFGAGMITGWGAHHVDTAHWGMDTELTGPVEVWAARSFPSRASGMYTGRSKHTDDTRTAWLMTISGEFGKRHQGYRRQRMALRVSRRHDDTHGVCHG